MMSGFSQGTTSNPGASSSIQVTDTHGQDVDQVIYASCQTQYLDFEKNIVVM